MTGFAVERTEALVRIGSRPPHPERTALVEARGALLLWNVLERSLHPVAEIHDLDQAADWLWEVYGPDAASAVLAGAEAVAADEESTVLVAARALAHLRWAEVWWPSSHEAGVPALALGLLRAEAAWRTSAVEHLLDDEDAVERALAGAFVTPEAPASLAGEARALAAVIEALAEDCGVVLEREQQGAQSDWALAAGGARSGEFALASGSAPLDWALVPHGVADAAGKATWSVAMRSGALSLAVSVPAAPEARDLPLTAGIAGVDVRLRLEGDAFTGEVEAPQGFMLLPTGEQTMQVYAPGFAIPTQPAPEAEARQAAILAFAAERLAAPDASLTERAAAQGIGA